jgi:hypothetical protein
MDIADTNGLSLYKWDNEKSATSITPPRTGLSGNQFSTLKTLE